MQICWPSCHNRQQYQVEELAKSTALFIVVTLFAVGVLLVPGVLALSGRISLSFPVAVDLIVNGAVIAAIALPMLVISVMRCCGQQPVSK